jgi:integrase
MGVRDDGTPDRRHVSARTETEVIAKVRKLERGRDDGQTTNAGRKMKVEAWLTHWLENIAEPSVRPKTYAGYRTAVRQYLIPGLGAHRIDRLQPEHIEKLYAKLRARGLKPATVHQAHRTLRTALNEAVRRGQLSTNPATIAKPPRLVEEEVEPLTVAEAQRVLKVAAGRRNGVRFALALALGIRQGEALGLQWRDLDAAAGTLTIRRALQRHTWRHGCDPVCGGKRGADCPDRRGGGLVIVETKSRSGRRTIGLPPPLVVWLQRHRLAQDGERDTAANLWEEGGWMFAQANGRPIDPRDDYDAWRNLLTAASVRPARLHDARHTAATMLLVLKVPTRAVMDVMGWSQASMTTRYQHVPAEVLTGIADLVGGLLWQLPEKTENAPPDDDDDGTAGVLAPTG